MHLHYGKLIRLITDMLKLSSTIYLPQGTYPKVIYMAYIDFERRVRPDGRPNARQRAGLRHGLRGAVRRHCIWARGADVEIAADGGGEQSQSPSGHGRPTAGAAGAPLRGGCEGARGARAKQEEAVVKGTLPAVRALGLRIRSEPMQAMGRWRPGPLSGGHVGAAPGSSRSSRPAR